MIFRTCVWFRLFNEAYRKPRLAALPENRPRRNHGAPVCVVDPILAVPRGSPIRAALPGCTRALSVGESARGRGCLSLSALARSVHPAWQRTASAPPRRAARCQAGCAAKSGLTACGCLDEARRGDLGVRVLDDAGELVPV